MGEESIEIRIHVPVLGAGSGLPTPVMRVQQMLNGRGLGPLDEDGVFGSWTEAAVRRFQEMRGFEVDGRVGPQTWPELLTQWLLASEEGC